MVLVGRLKISYQDLFYYSYSDLLLLLKGHEIEKRDDWERARMNSYWNVNPYIKGAKKPSHVFPLPWDSDKGFEIRDIKALKESILKAKEVFRKHGKVRN